MVLKISENEKSLIYRNYRLAKDQANQIIVEAELRNCDINDIKSILAEFGEDVEKYNYKFISGCWKLVAGIQTKLTKAKRNRVLELIDQGKSNREIADEVGTSHSSVNSIRQAYELKKLEVMDCNKREFKKANEIRTLYDKGLTDSEIAEELKIGKSTVYNWRILEDLPSNYKRKSVNSSKLLELYEMGLTDSEIAEKLGKSQSCIQKRRTDLGLIPNRKRKIA